MIRTTRQSPSRLVRLLACLCAALFSAAAPGQDEDTVKIGYLYNFAKFGEWPPAVESSPGKSWTFCVLGDEIVKTVSALLEGKLVRQNPIAVVNAKHRSGLSGCQVAYASVSENWRIGAMLKEARGQPILTVSDADGFVAQGGMIGLVREGGKLRFEINLGAAGQAGLKVGAQLAKLAVKTVNTGN